MRLNDRTAIVTGASMGIGEATALRLARHGTTVYAVARSKDRLEALATRHPNIRPLVADVTNELDRERIVETAGRVDILVNNAGLAVHGNVDTLTPEEIALMFDVNVVALVDLSRRVLPGMKQRRSGHICNVGSIISYQVIPPLTLYGATKCAVQGFTNGLRWETARTGVRVSLIQPGPVKTGFSDRATKGDRPDVLSSSGGGLSAEWVGKAICRTIRMDHVPGYATVAVPRALGIGRILSFPIISQGIDLGVKLGKRQQ